jgi:hypothetical protein
MQVHLLVEYENDVTLDVFSNVDLQIMEIISVHPYKISDDTCCKCGASQCQGCLFNFRKITFIEVVYYKLPLMGNFGEELIKKWLRSIEYE